MAGNTFGKILRLTTFGESHGKAIGGILDGFPAGVRIDLNQIQHDLDRRKPGQSDLSSPRKEPDQLEILSGIFEDISLGSPIGFLVWNRDQKPADYSHLKTAYRPSHADFTFDKKYGIRDYRGGGRASARETISRVVGGSFAKMMLNTEGINITAFVNRIGTVSIESASGNVTHAAIESSLVRCPDAEKSKEMIELIRQTALDGDTLGGEITCLIANMPAGLGEPVFDKLHADLAKAMMSINAVKGFEIGSGFAASQMKGSQHNDQFENSGGNISTVTNHSGGIQGGISNGMDIYFKMAFKPVATLMQKQMSVEAGGEKVVLEGKGRHDVCVVPRAVPIVEAMAALVIADHFLQNRSSKI